MKVTSGYLFDPQHLLKVRVIPGGPTVENDIAVDSQPSSQILNGHSKTTDVLRS